MNILFFVEAICGKGGLVLINKDEISNDYGRKKRQNLHCSKNISKK